jgi:hypothetical protein
MANFHSISCLTLSSFGTKVIDYGVRNEEERGRNKKYGLNLDFLTPPPDMFLSPQSVSDWLLFQLHSYGAQWIIRKADRQCPE